MNRLKKFMYIPLLLALLELATGCSHRGKFEDHLRNKNCEKALLEVPENQSIYQISSKTQQAGGTLISYSFVGAAYTAQILWDVSVGLTSSIVLCAPGIALSMAKSTNSSANFGPTCFSADITKLMSPPLGRRTLDSSANLRCPDLSGLTASLREVAACFAAKGTQSDRGRASKILESLQNSGGFYSCLKAEDRVRVSNELAEYRRLNTQDRPSIEDIK